MELFEFRLFIRSVFLMHHFFLNCCHPFIHRIPHSFPHPIPQVSLIIPVTFYLISSLPLIVRDCGGLVARADPPEQFPA